MDLSKLIFMQPQAGDVFDRQIVFIQDKPCIEINFLMSHIVISKIRRVKRKVEFDIIDFTIENDYQAAKLMGYISYNMKDLETFV